MDSYYLLKISLLSAQPITKCFTGDKNRGYKLRLPGTVYFTFVLDIM